MTLRPLHDRVVLRRLDSKEKTKGGIIMGVLYATPGRKAA